MAVTCSLPDGNWETMSGIPSSSYKDVEFIGLSATTSYTLVVRDDYGFVNVQLGPFYSDSRGVVVLYDVDRIFKQKLIDYSAKRITLTIGSSQFERFVFYCDANVPRNYFRGRYLTRLTQTRVFRGAKILLPKSNGVALLDYSVAGANDTLTVYSSGEQRMALRFVDAPPEGNPAFKFRNSFGKMEYLYCWGPMTVDSSFKREQSYVNGSLTEVKRDETRSFKCNTGYLTVEEQEWVGDFFRSEEVYMVPVWTRCSEGDVFRRVVITDSKMEMSTADDALVYATFTVQLSDRNPCIGGNLEEGERFSSVFSEEFGNRYALRSAN